ncbi:transporter substrate-binding domain-containing protein [Flavobacteriaceae bacterium TP-CH-4]|uniref:Transporter substrate-binding domain-containing protein n=1 Tax=Pelagihabitans pacificus TaxID=2696054 RepID=A0A967AU93_9FLAO|nr:transporter substrate-binding domain-containing protein [Pelagihabitans pacificus]NHF60052.1 transporter substrate-binding domain-containing protein [Pelagihabitans pacificus]
MKRLLAFWAAVLLLQTIPAQEEKDTLLVGYTTAPPFIVENNGVAQGINVWLWERVAKDLDLEYRMVPMSFSPMLDSLKAGSIDISINPLTITSERSKLMEFTHSFYASNATIAVAEQSSFQKLLQFIQGFFSLNFLKGLLVLLGIIILFGLVGWYFERKANPEHFRGGIKGIWDGLWWSAVTLTTVGYGDKAPKSGYGKVAALILMFTGLLFISGLTASIASSLTVNQLSSNPDSFNEFKDRAVGSVNNTGSIQFLRAHFFKNVKGFDNVSVGLNSLKNNRIEAFVYDEPILQYRIQTDSTLGTISILPIKFDVQFYAFGLAKDKVALEQAISQRILEIIETEEWRIVLNEYGLTEI